MGNVNPKADGQTTRQDPLTNEENYARMGGDEAASGGVLPTPAEGLTATPSKEVAAVVNRTKTDLLAGLTAAQSAFEHARATRVDAILFARSVGLTYQAIGEKLGITEGAVRYILKSQGGGGRVAP